MVKRFTISVSKKRNLYLIIHGIQAEKSNYIKNVEYNSLTHRMQKADREAEFISHLPHLLKIVLKSKKRTKINFTRQNQNIPIPAPQGKDYSCCPSRSRTHSGLRKHLSEESFDVFLLLQTEELKGDALVPMVVEAIVHEDAQV